MAIASFSWLQHYFLRKTFYPSRQYAVRWLRKKTTNHKTLCLSLKSRNRSIMELKQDLKSEIDFFH